MTCSARTTFQSSRKDAVVRATYWYSESNFDGSDQLPSLPTIAASYQCQNRSDRRSLPLVHFFYGRLASVDPGPRYSLTGYM